MAIVFILGCVPDALASEAFDAAVPDETVPVDDGYAVDIADNYDPSPEGQALVDQYLAGNADADTVSEPVDDLESEPDTAESSEPDVEQDAIDRDLALLDEMDDHPPVGIRDDGLEQTPVRVSLMYFDTVPEQLYLDNVVPETNVSYSAAQTLRDDGMVAILANPNADVLPLPDTTPGFHVILDYASSGAAPSGSCPTDITHLCAYDTATGIVTVPNEYFGRSLTVQWWQSTELLNRAVPARVKFVNAVSGEENMIETQLPVYAMDISVSLPQDQWFDAVNVSQGGAPPIACYVNEGSIFMGTPPAGGEVTIIYTAKEAMTEDLSEMTDAEREEYYQEQQEIVDNTSPLDEEVLDKLQDEVIRGENGHTAPGDTEAPIMMPVGITGELREQILAEREERSLQNENSTADTSAVEIVSEEDDTVRAHAPKMVPDALSDELPAEEPDIAPATVQNEQPGGAFTFNDVQYTAPAGVPATYSDGAPGSETYAITNARIFNAPGEYDMPGTTAAFGYDEALTRDGVTLDPAHSEYGRKYGFYVQILGCENPDLIMNEKNMIGRKAKVNIEYMHQVRNRDYTWTTNAKEAQKEPYLSAGITEVWTVRGECGGGAKSNGVGTPVIDTNNSSTITLESVDGDMEHWTFQIHCVADFDGHKMQTVVGDLYKYKGGKHTLWIKKMSWLPEVTTGNFAYSLTGCQFEVKDGKGNYVDTLTVNDDGWAMIENCPPGEYRIRETVFGKNFEKADIRNSATWTVTMDAAGQLTGNNVKQYADGRYVLEATNYPDMDPVKILATKVEVLGGRRLGGAKIRVDYYNNIWMSWQQIDNVNPTRSWIFVTHGEECKQCVERNQIGEIRYDPHWIDSGADGQTTEELYKNKNNQLALPLGTIAIYEVEPPPENKYGIKFDLCETKYRIYELRGDQVQEFEHLPSTYPEGGPTIPEINQNGGSFTFQKLDAEVGLIELRQGYRGGEPWVDSLGRELDEFGNLYDPTAKYAAAQGAGALGPAKYTLSLKSGGPVQIGDQEVKNGQKIPGLDVITDERGWYQSPDGYLPEGVYTLTEQEPPPFYRAEHPGWLQDEDKNRLSVTITIKPGECTEITVPERTIQNEVMRGGVAIQKYDALSDAEAQGNASLENTLFVIWNMNLQDVWVKRPDNGKLQRVEGWNTRAWEANKDNRYKRFVTGEELQKLAYARGDANGAGVVTMSLKSNTKGVASTEIDTLPLGKYRIMEAIGPPGMMQSPVYRDFEISEDGKIVQLFDKGRGIVDQPVRGGVRIYKRDADLGDEGMQEVELPADYPMPNGGEAGGTHKCPVGTTQGNGTLHGIKFAIINRSNKFVVVNAKKVAVGEVCCIIETDENGIAQTARDALPCGTYEIVEVEGNDSYVVDTSNSRTFSIQITPDNNPTGSAKNAFGNTEGAAQTVLDGLDNGLWKVFSWEQFENKSSDDAIEVSDHQWRHPFDFYVGPGVENTAVRGDLVIEKYDEVSRQRVAQGDATLQNAAFDIINLTQDSNGNGRSIYVDDNGTIPYEGVVCTIYTDATGVARTKENYLPLGNYRVEEKDGGQPVGYLHEGSFLYRDFTIRPDSMHIRYTGYSKAITNRPITSSIRVRKADFDKTANNPSDEKPQGNASLAGTVFAIYNRSAKTVYIKNPSNPNLQTAYAPGQKIIEITTNSDGYATTLNNYLPYGTYGVIEVTPPSGYHDRVFEDEKDPDYPDHGDLTCPAGMSESEWRKREEKIVTIREHNVPATITDDPFVNEVKRGDFTVAKFDAETPDGAQGDASLAGCKFQLINISENSIMVGDGEDGLGDLVEVAPGKELPILLETKEGEAAKTPPEYLPIGQYRCKEIEPPPGYTNAQEAETIFNITEDALHQYKVDYLTGFQNYPIRGGVKIAKRDAEEGMNAEPEGNASLAGAEFELINRSEKNQAVMITSGRTTKRVYPGETLPIQLITDETGEASTSATALPYGTYGLREVKAPYGYKFSDEEIVFHICEDGEIVDLEADLNLPFRDSVHRIRIEVQKFDSELGAEPQGKATLEGAEITIYNDSAYAVMVPDSSGEMKKIDTGEPIITLVTNKEGKATTADNYLPVGRYRVKETRPPHDAENDCYLTTPGGVPTTELIVDTAEFDYIENPIVSLTSPQRGFVNDVVKGGVLVVKRDADLYGNLSYSKNPQGGASLAGAVFEIRSQNDNKVVVNGQAYERDQVVLTLTTNNEGEARTAANVLPYGTYSVREVSPPPGYLLSDQVLTFDIKSRGQTVTLESQPILDKVKTFDLVIAKFDTETAGTAQGGATFANTVFKIINKNDKPVVVNGNPIVKDGTVAFITANAQGIGQTHDGFLPVGKYLVQEYTKPDGYLESGILSREIEVTDQSWDKMTDKTVYMTTADTAIANDVIKGGVQIMKRDATRHDNRPSGNAKLSGAVFDIINKSQGPVDVVDEYGQHKLVPRNETVCHITTDENGLAKTGQRDLPYGHYLVRESVAPEGYLVSEETREFDVQLDGRYVDLISPELSFHDVPILGSVEVEKWDIELQAPMPQGSATLKGTVIELWNRSTNSVFVDGHEYPPNSIIKINGGDLVTDSNGYATTGAQKLPYGAYELVEKTAPSGYLAGAPSLPFVINSDQQMISFRTHGANFENKVARGTAKIYKVDSQTGSTPQGDAKLEGAEYEIINKNQYILAGGEPYSFDQVVYTFQTDENGYADIKVEGNRYENEYILPVGNYALREKNPPEGYRRTGTVTPFEIMKDGDVVEFSGSRACQDDVIRGGIRIRKIDDATGGTPQGEASLADAEFRIYNRSTHAVQVLGELIQPGGLCFTLHTNEAGYAETTNDLLPYGSYGVVEQSPPPGYLNDPSARERIVHIRVDREIVDITGDAQIFKNTPIRGSVKIRKVDAEQPSVGLGGALIEIVNRSRYPVLVNNEMIAPGNVVLSGLTNDNGDFQTLPRALPYGKYEIREAAPPVGYVPRGITSREFTITSDGQHVDLTGPDDCLTNDPIRGDIFATKMTSENDRPLAGVPFMITNESTGENHIVVTDENGYFSTASTHNPHGQNTNRGETSKDGVWWGPISALDESKGALTYGHYIIDELPCPANANRMLIKGFTFDIRQNGSFEVPIPKNQPIGPDSIGSTTAADANTRVRFAYPSQTATVTDTVYYYGVTPGARYTLKSWLVDGETGAIITPKKEQTFTPVDQEGNETVTLTYNTTGHRKVVVCEELFDVNGSSRSLHDDINDEQQTVEIMTPSITTKASFVDGTQVSTIRDTVRIYDEVNYSGLIPGLPHTIKGRLVYTGTATPVMHNGAPVIAELTWNPVSSSGQQNVYFDVNGIDLAGRQVTVLQVIEYKNSVVASHEDPREETQTVRFGTSSISTTLATRDNQKIAPVRPAAQLIDTVDCRGLNVGTQYTLDGTLYIRETGQPLFQNGMPVTGRTLFTATSENIPVQVPFTVNTMELQGRHLVCFQRLTVNGQMVAEEQDIGNASQTISIPQLEIQTTATNADGGKLLQPGQGVVIKDRVEYSGLIPGMAYTMHGIVMTTPDVAARTASSEATGSPKSVTSLSDVLESMTPSPFLPESIFEGGAGGLVPLRNAAGDAYEVIERFVPERAAGDVTLSFPIDARNLAGAKLVIYEDLSISGTSVAQHKEASSEAQTVRVDMPDIDTYAAGSDGSKTIAAAPEAVIVDTVSLSGLTVGEKYTLYGTLMDKATNAAVKVDGVAVTSRAEFTAQKPEDSVHVTFTVDTSALVNHELVVFEKLYSDNVMITLHEDIGDKDQTVTVRKPTLSTSAQNVYETDKKTIPANRDQIIVDTIVYNDVEPDQVYTVKGTIWDKTAGAFISIGGSPLTVTEEIKPTASTGSVKMSFTVDATGLEDHTLVVYEELLSRNTVIAEHKDPTDRDQSITVGPPDGVPTGDEPFNPLFIILLAASGGILVTWLILRRRNALAGR